MEHWRLVIIAEPKTIHFDLPKDVGDNLKHEIDFIIKHNKLLTERTYNKKISRLLFKISMEAIYINTENRTINMLLCKTYLIITREKLLDTLQK